jgi:ubiquinone/menaquinone biosynthesis C-methylase UbiE
MHIGPTEQVLHISFDDEPYPRADAFCGNFSKRQLTNKAYKQFDINITTLPFRDKQYDLVYCTNTLAYVTQPLKVFEEIKRVAKRAFIQERSEFAEMIFGWDQTKWIIDVENNEFVVKAKNVQKVGRFGPLFHHYYANDPTFFDYMSKNPGLLKTSVEWYCEDDQLIDLGNGKTEIKTVFRPCQTEYFEDARLLIGNISDKIDVRQLKNKLKE